MFTTLPRTLVRTTALVAAFSAPALVAAQSSELARQGRHGAGIVTQSLGPVQTFALANDDDCATSTDLQSGPGFYTYDLSGATTGIQGQGNQLCNFYGQSNITRDIWFRWTATWTGRVELSTCGDPTDSRIAAYSGGASCPVANAIACNDDACGLQSNLVFDVTNGTRYLIQLGAFPGAAGSAGTLTITDFDRPCGYRQDPASGYEDAIGLTNGGELAYLNYFEAVGGADVITKVSLAYGASGGNFPDGMTARVVLWNDPTNDANPSDAVVLWSMNTTTTLSSTGQLNDYNVPNVAVNGGFWVGAIVGHTANQFPAVYDQSLNSFGRAWLVGQVGGTVDPMNLAGAGVAPLPINALNVALGADGFFLARAEGVGSNCGSGGLGSNYCSANPNSTGGTGLASALGSSLVAANNVVLRASNLPHNVFGFFITSRTQGFVMNPGGSAGNLCVTGAIGRYVGPGQVQSSGASGALQLTIDLQAMPAPNGAVAVQPGDTWNFQAWHRDAVGGSAISNFTNGLSVTFL